MFIHHKYLTHFVVTNYYFSNSIYVNKTIFFTVTLPKTTTKTKFYQLNEYYLETPR